VLRRDKLWREDGKPNFIAQAKEEFLGQAGAELTDIQTSLFEEARQRRDASIVRNIDSLDGLAKYYSDDQRHPGWVEFGWAKPTGAELDEVVTKLKALKLTVRNTPMDGGPVTGVCPFTGRPAIERIYVARAY
jgi:prolyl-tRNA synthetase